MNSTAAQARASPQKKKSQTQRLFGDILWLLIKVMFICTAAILLFTFMFGIYRNTEPSMNPAIKDGDLVIYYRLDREYDISDVIVAEYQGKEIALRVVAAAGDEVDIRDGGLYVNGARQAERNIFKTTDRYTDGADFPLTVPKGKVFALGDNRTDATDCRIFGPISIADTKGTVMSLIRRRGI